MPMAAKRKKPGFTLSVIPVLVLFSLLVVSALFFSSLFSKYQTKRTQIIVAKITPREGKIAPPRTGAFLGISLDSQDYSSLAATEAEVRKHFVIVGSYQSWGGENTRFNQEWAFTSASHGSIPFITWEPWVPVSGFDRSEEKVDEKAYRLSRIAQGKFD